MVSVAIDVYLVGIDTERWKRRKSLSSILGCFQYGYLRCGFYYHDLVFVHNELYPIHVNGVYVQHLAYIAHPLHKRYIYWARNTERI